MRLIIEIRQHSVAQKVRDIAVRARKATDQLRPAANRAQSQGCQLQTRDPTLGAFGEKARQCWFERFAHGTAEELVALGIAELERLGIDLQQLVQQAQAVQRQ